MNMNEWAKREVEIASEKEREPKSVKNQGVLNKIVSWLFHKKEFDYGCACYDSALRAFNSLCEDGHSGMSIRITKNILDRLIDGKPLTPIEDVPEAWNDVTEMFSDGQISYQCKRMSSLFKYVFPNGHIEYRDVDQCYCKDKDDPNNTYTCGLVSRIIEEMYPITMPYMPDSKGTKVFTSECLTDVKNGDLDTMAIWYCIRPDGEKVEINRFFKDSESESGWDEISAEEYATRKENEVKK